MKLIIDIPKKNFVKDDLIRFFGCYSQKLDEVIKNGIPLDNLRAEIADMPKLYPFVNHIDTYVKVDDVLAIIDKYRKEASK